MRRQCLLRCAAPMLDFLLEKSVSLIPKAGTDAPPLPSTVSLGVDVALNIFSEMWTIRNLEAVCSEYYAEKEVRGFLHLQTGQEAIPVGTVTAMEKVDTYSGSYRIHGWHYMLTKNIESTIGEVAGRSCGTSKGKGGSMHLYAPSEGLYGGQGIVGAQVPLAAGLAFAASYMRDTPAYASVTMFGDGALNQGQIAETWNMAALYKLPMIFCLEDNKYSMGTAVSRGSAEASFSNRVPYMAHLKVDGMDVVATYAAMRYARQYVMSGLGPIGVHFDAYRFVNHSASDKGSYRPDGELDRMKKERDPIATFQEKLLTRMPELRPKLTEVEDAADTKVSAASEKVLKSPLPPASELFSDVYVGEPVSVRMRQSTQYI